LDSEKFNNFAAGIQSIVFSIGLVCAGIWGIYQFNSNKYKSLDLELTASQIKSSKDNKPVIWAQLKLQNDGNTSVVLPLGTRSLIANRIEFKENGDIKSKSKLTTSNYSFIFDESISSSDELIIDTNSNKKLDFLFQANQIGIYMIEFRSYDKTNNAYWTASTVIDVK